MSIARPVPLQERFRVIIKVKLKLVKEVRRVIDHFREGCH